MVMMASSPTYVFERRRGATGLGGRVAAARRPHVVGGRGWRRRALIGAPAPARWSVDGAHEVVAALGVGAVPVERRAGRRQEHDVAGPGERGRPRPRRRPSRWPCAPGAAPSNAAATSGAASPMATTARMWSASSASSPRSRPLLRPPAISTTDGNPRTRRAGGVGRGGLRVVVPAHASSLAHQRHPMGEPPEGQQGVVRARPRCRRRGAPRRPRPARWRGRAGRPGSARRPRPAPRRRRAPAGRPRRGGRRRARGRT